MNRKNEIEVLAPAGSYDILTAAINAGADAVYVGGDIFGARAYAGNFNQEELLRAIDYCHIHNRKLYLTVNTLLKNNELDGLLYDYLKPYYEAGLDAVIVQDMGVFDMVRKHFPLMDIHCSTQMTITGYEGARLLKEQGAARVVTAREMNLDEIRKINDNVDIEIESFVHGALCYCYSGQCLYSSMIGGRSGNRGRCAQPCRMQYSVEDSDSKEIYANNEYILSMKDMCTLDILPEVIDAGVYSLKIEGRMKSREYVAGTVSMYRKYVDKALDYLNRYECSDKNNRKKYYVDKQDISLLMDLYNRGEFTTGYYNTENGRNMQSITRPNHCGTKALKVQENVKGRITAVALEKLNPQDIIEVDKDFSITIKNTVEKGEKYTVNIPAKYKVTKAMVLLRVRNNQIIDSLDREFCSQEISELVNGTIKLIPGEKLELKVCLKKNSNINVTAYGDIVQSAQNQPASVEKIQKQLNKTGQTHYEFAEIKVVTDNAFVPVQQINELRRNALDMLDDKICSLYRRQISENISDEQITINNTDKDTEKTSNFVTVKRLEQLLEVCNNKIADIVCVDDELLQSEKWMTIYSMIKESGKLCYYGSPAVLKGRYTDAYLSTLKKIDSIGCDGVLIRNLEELAIVLNEEFYTKDIILDYNMYGFNSKAIDYYYRTCEGKANLKAVTYPLELNFYDMNQIKSPYDKMLVIYGRAPMMISAQCVKKTTGNCGKRNNVRIIDRKNEYLSVHNNCRYCYSTIYNYNTTYIADCIEEIKRISPRFLRIDFTDENAETTAKVLSCISDNNSIDNLNLISNMTRGHYMRGVE